jgi:succinate dehydrogenase (ubiquinone) membrane anchor subunit
MVLDTALCGAMLLHTHWRLSGVVQDYIHGSAYYFFKYLVLVLSITSFGSLCYFNYADIGFARAARLIYSQL